MKPSWVGKNFKKVQPKRFADGGPVEDDGLLTHDGYPARKNADGSRSTEMLITVTDPRLNDGKATNIPSLWKGEEVDDDVAVGHVLKSGRKYPSFDSIESAVDAAKQRSSAGGAKNGKMYK